jgi:hypothetical protein
MLTWYFSMSAWKALGRCDFFAIVGLAAQFALDTISGIRDRARLAIRAPYKVTESCRPVVE